MNKLREFDKQFVMDLFLESDSISTVNRLSVAVANVVHENNENMSLLTKILQKEIYFKPYERLSAQVESSPKRIKYFYERTVLNYTACEYEEVFKMKKTTVEAILQQIKKSYKSSNSVVPLDKKLHIFLWLLTTDSSYNEVGVLFNLHKSSVNYIINEIAELIAMQHFEVIRWPSAEEQHLTRIRVHSRLKLPNCIGFIDACRLKVSSNNKKSKAEVLLLQAVCDDSLLFTDIFIGDVGKTKKYKVFKDSPLSKDLKEYIQYENHILGDSEYKLKINLITPFSSEELLTSEEMRFNETHLKARGYIGRSFELLKERFRKLNHLDMNKIDTVTLLIQAACILHNLIIANEGVDSEIIKEEFVLCEDGVTIDDSIVTNAVEKRLFLCNYVNYIDSS